MADQHEHSAPATVVPVATRYEFRPAAIFDGDPMETADLYDSHAITVDWRGGGTWCVSRGHGWSVQYVWCEKKGEWEAEPSPSNRDANFLRRTRYQLDQALAIGSRLATNGAPRP